MFNPTRDQARQFFIDAWQKRGAGQPLTALELQAADIIALHPEYHALLGDPEDARARDWLPEQGESNPFLHLSLHLAIEEQLSIDQPPGIRQAIESLYARYPNRHAALHRALDCLGEMVWRSQRDRRPPDAAAYLACLRKPP